MIAKRLGYGLIDACAAFDLLQENGRRARGRLYDD
jgi:hypothetical protein